MAGTEPDQWRQGGQAAAREHRRAADYVVAAGAALDRVADLPFPGGVQHQSVYFPRMAKPLGGPKYVLKEPTHLLGAFVSRTGWGLTLFGAILALGRVPGSTAAIYDAELEKTHACARCLLLIAGLMLVWSNLIPFFKRGNEFQVHPDGSVSVRRGDSWEPLMEYQYSVVTADGRTIEFTPPPDGPPKIMLPQDRVFSREYGVRLPDGRSGRLEPCS
jgi:hypothetical protein